MTDAIQRLAAESEIRRQLYTCCRALDRLDADLLKSVWHPVATIADEVMEIEGAAAHWADRVVEELRGWVRHSHQISNALIDVHGDRAVSEVYLALTRRRPDDAGRTVDEHCRARWLDRWEKSDGRWAINRRQAIVNFSWEQTGATARNGVRARRDRSDPVFGLLESLKERV